MKVRSLERLTLAIPRIMLFFAAVALIAFAGCASGSDSDDEDSGDDGDSNGGGSNVEESFRIDAVTDASGIAQAEFNLADGANKFAVTAFTPSSSGQVRFVELSSSAGANFLNPGGLEISFATFFSNAVNSVNAPSRDVDPTPSSGDTIRVAAEALSSGGAPLEGATVSMLVTSRSDGSFSGGTLPVNIFFVGEIGDDSSVRQVVDLAISEFRSIYSNQMGIGLDIRTFDLDGPLLLPSPFEGSALYESASNTAGGLGVNILIGGDIQGSEGEVLGVAGGIIAPPIPSRRSGLAISIFTGAGPDGVYSETDVRVLGETLAHEVGHYAGLFHPVDFDGDDAAATDPLNDTNSCSTFVQCLGDDSLTSNLMFTTPVSDGDGGFVRQNQLSDQQSGVVNRYAAVD